jgi:uncharacterized protein DUF929
LDGGDMGKASRSKQDGTGSRRDKIAAQRAEAQRAERRNRLLIAGGAIIVVIAVVVVLVVVKATSSNKSSASSTAAPTGTALSSVIKTLTSVPVSVTDAVGDGGGSVTGFPQVVTGETALTSAGKPEVLYIGAEYCPYCAAERWAMIVALSRFGTFSGLSTMHSSSTDVYANTPTWTFHGSTYTSQYLTFTPKEMYTDIPTSSGGYTTLDSLSSDQSAIFAKLDAPPYVQSTSDSESYPFVDFGNQYVIVGASYNPQTLDGLGWATIANDLSKPSSSVAKAVDGTANYMTAALCKLTNNQPSTACTSTVTGLQSKLQAPS